MLGNYSLKNISLSSTIKMSNVCISLQMQHIIFYFACSSKIFSSCFTTKKIQVFLKANLNVKIFSNTAILQLKGSKIRKGSFVIIIL